MAEILIPAPGVDYGNTDNDILGKKDMAYNALNNLVDTYIYANGVQAITGTILNNVLKTMISQLGRGYHLMGVTYPASSPAANNDEPFAYFAATAGTYTNFGGLTLVPGEVAVLINAGDGTWSKQTIYTVPTTTADLTNTTGFITKAVTNLVNYYTKAETETKLGGYYKKTETYDKDQVDSIVAALSRQEYIVAWDGQSTPIAAAIPAGVTVTYSGTTYTGTRAASATTLNKIYMVWNGTAYDMYGTSQNGGYTWVPMGTTSVDLSQYAKEVDLKAVAEKVQNVTFIPSSGGEEVVEFQTNGGQFIAKVSTDGVEAVDVKARIGGNSVSLTGLYSDDANTDGGSLLIGDNNSRNIVQFERGHIFTKFFNSENVIADIEDLKQGGGSATIDDKRQRQLSLKEDYLSYKYGKFPVDYSYNWYERARILHFSDNHVNLGNLAEMMELKDLVHLVVDTGDNSNSGQNTPSANTLADFQGYIDTVGDTSLPLLITQGNHDSYGDITKEQYFNSMSALMASKCPSFIFGDAEHYRSYGYMDITPNETVGTIRIILLDAFDYDDGQFMNPYGQQGATPNPTIPPFGNNFSPMNCVFSQTQINWFISTMQIAANNGYKVITAMHYAFGDAHDYSESGSARTDCFFHQDPFMIPDIIDAMQHKTTLSKTYLDDENINNITINEDFSNIGDLHYICHLFGHLHSENDYQCQKSDGSKFYDMLMLGAPSMGADKSTGKVLNKVPKQPGTLNSIKLTILEIDTVSHDVYRVNYGAYKAFDMSTTERSKKIPYRFIL